MTIERSQESTLSSAGHLSSGSIIRELNGIVAGAVELWEGGATPDAKKLIEAYPQFRDHPSLALELVYEEYCRHRDSGHEIDVTVFCQRFSWLSSSIRRMIEVHDAFEPHAATKRSIRWPQEGDEICGFRIVAPIGTGSFSRVYVATQTEIGDRLVTIKVAELLYDEARLMGRLAHDAIVPVLSVHHDVSAGLSVICMPYRGATTLEDALNATQAQSYIPTDGAFLCEVVARRNLGLPTVENSTPKVQEYDRYWQAVIQIALPLADALESAHSKGVVHRDIKPSNVLLAPLCQPQLLDFNLSTDQQDTTGRIGGTISYMPLEQLEVLVGLRKSAELTPAVDIYALGVVLYELLTGRLPFVFSEVRDLQGALIARRAVADSGLATLRSINDAVPASIDAIIMRCLRESVYARPTPAQLRDELSQILRAPLKQQQRRRRVLAYGAFAIGCSGIGGLMYHAGLGTAPERPSGPPSIEQLVKLANQDLLASRVNDALASLQEAYRQQTSPWLALGIAECLTRQKNYRGAKTYWEMAIPTFSFVPEGQNNYAHCLIQLRDYPRALAMVDDVSKRSPLMQEAWLNRSLLFIRLPDNQFSAQEAIGSIERAMKIGPPSAQQALYAAQIHARSIQERPASRREGVQALREAVRLGADLANMKQLTWISAFNLSPDYSELTSGTTDSAKSTTANLLARVLVPFPFPQLTGERSNVER